MSFMYIPNLSLNKFNDYVFANSVELQNNTIILDNQEVQNCQI